MEGFVYIALFLFSIAFAVAAGYLSFVLHRTKAMLKSVDKTMNDVEKEVTSLIPHMRETIRQTDHMADDIDAKVKSTDNWFVTAENVGHTVDAAQTIVSNSTKHLTDADIYKKSRYLAEGMKWSEVALSLYSQWKKKR